MSQSRMDEPTARRLHAELAARLPKMRAHADDANLRDEFAQCYRGLLLAECELNAELVPASELAEVAEITRRSVDWFVAGRGERGGYAMSGPTADRMVLDGDAIDQKIAELRALVLNDLDPRDVRDSALRAVIRQWDAISSDSEVWNATCGLLDYATNASADDVNAVGLQSALAQVVLAVEGIAIQTSPGDAAQYMKARAALGMVSAAFDQILLDVALQPLFEVGMHPVQLRDRPTQTQARPA